MVDVFISYSGDDRGKAEVLARALAGQGWQVWWDRSIPTGEEYRTVIETALRDARCVLVLWSPRSVRSRWVCAEAEDAWSRQALVPVQIEACRPPLPFGTLQTADLTRWGGDASDPAFARLAADIERFAPRTASAGAGRPVVTSVGGGRRKRRLAVVGVAGALAAAVAFYAFRAYYATWSLPPEIVRFDAARASVERGESVRLTWSVRRADSVEIVKTAGRRSQNLGRFQKLDGELEDVVQSDAGYTLSAHAANGKSAVSVPVSVKVIRRAQPVSPEPPPVDRKGEALELARAWFAAWLRGDGDTVVRLAAMPFSLSGKRYASSDELRRANALAHSQKAARENWETMQIEAGEVRRVKDPAEVAVDQPTSLPPDLAPEDYVVTLWFRRPHADAIRFSVFVGLRHGRLQVLGGAG
ncbi:MAG: toll/interleukin-1 receptor domain-containing protein [Acidobacteria bacterium]|nr:toll/interleukin-1 receptor domain-containing protein [Acidobacteriota bacterium]